MISRPNYKDFLTQTLTASEELPTYPRTPTADNRPPLPHRPKRSTLPETVDPSQSLISYAIANDLKDKPFLRQTFNTKGEKRLNSLKKRDGSKSAKDLSVDRVRLQPSGRTNQKQETSYYQKNSNNFSYSTNLELPRHLSSKNSFTDKHNRPESRSKGNIYTPYDLYKSSSYRDNKYEKRPVTAIDSSKYNNQYTSFLDPKKLPTGQTDRSRDKTPRSRKGSENGPNLNLFTPIQFRNKVSTVQKSDPRDYRPRSREKSKSPLKVALQSSFRQQEKQRKSSLQIEERKLEQIHLKVQENRSSFGSAKSKMSVDDFEIGKKLGEGRFGHVFLVIHKATGAIFALKRIPKSTIKESMMMNQFSLEVRLQASFYHPNIVSLYAVFDDKQYVYLLTEYLSDGSLYSELKKKGKFSEEEAAARIYNLCRAVETLHLRGVAHRDIKPENIMMCAKECKLGDFGWATICDTRRMTYCGTTDYVSPEIIEGKEYGQGVDMWCVGVLAYELLSGRPPFYHLSRQETFKKIEEATPSYPPFFSPEAKDFISKLLRKVPEERMSSVDTLLHPFLGRAEK